MAGNDNKTIATSASVDDFIAAIEHPVRREDARLLLEMFARVTEEKPVIWGDSIIGFGQYHYRYESGREGDFLRTGFSPRKSYMAIYLMGGYCDEQTQARQAQLLGKLGPYKMGKSCLNITRLDRVDLDVLEQLVAESWAAMLRKYPAI